MTRSARYDEYLTTTAGRELYRRHGGSTTGVWQVFGEEPNGDLGGHHACPDLGTYSGALADVVEYAVELPRFWTWGSGGKIVKVPDPKVITRDTVAKRALIQNEIARLSDEIKELEHQLASL